MDVLRFRVVDMVAETKDSYSFFLKFLGEGDINYISGQYLPVKIPHEEGILFRSYSLSSSSSPAVSVRIAPDSCTRHRPCLDRRTL